MSAVPLRTESRLDEAKLSVLLDLRHPLSYLALHPTADFGRRLGIEINWLPVRIPVLRAPTQPGSEDDRGVLHRRHRAEAIAREIKTYSTAQGLSLEGFYRDTHPEAAYAAWLWGREALGGRLFPFLSELFRAYWALELDPSDVNAVAAIVERTAFSEAMDGGETPSGSASGSEFLAWFAGHGAGSVVSLSEELEGRGLSGAPLYRLEDEIFVGRQHLPMLEWILAGRSGPGPI